MTYDSEQHRRRPSKRALLLLSGLAVVTILACAGCLVLGTALWATVNSRARATEQAAVQATASAESPALPGQEAGSTLSETLKVEESAPAAASSTTTQTLKAGETPPGPEPGGIVPTIEITVSQSPTLPMAASSSVTPTASAATAFTVQPLDVPGPSEALELTPTQQLTLSSVIFIENAGQFPADIRFQVRGATGGGLWLASDAIWLTLVESRAGQLDPAAGLAAGTEPPAGQGVRLKFSFVGANPSPEIVPLERLDTHASYFFGSDPAGWRTDVPVWGGVRYKDIYPGVDLELSGQGGQYMQRLVVQPGADLAQVRLRVDGVDGLALEPLPATTDEPDSNESSLEPQPSANAAQLGNGGYYLRLSTAFGDLSLPLLALTGADGSPLPATALPSLSTDGEGQVVSSPFLLRPEAKSLPDSTRVLPPGSSATDETIHLLYSAFLGRGGNDTSRAVAVDELGNAYTSGDTYFPTFPAQAGPFDLSSGGSYDAFAAKINATGTELAYVTFVGGSGKESSSGIAVDAAGNAYLAGRTESTDLPTTAQAFDAQHHSGADAFVIKLNALGTELSYATFLGGDGDDSAQAIAVDGTGSAYVTGATESTNFPATTGALDVASNGEWDAFVVKVNGAGTGLAYSTFLGGSGAEQGTAIAVDSAGNAFLAGSTLSADFPTTAGAFATSPGGQADAFVAKLNGSGTDLAYATFLGGSRADYAASIAVDSAGNAFVTGSSQSPDFPTMPWAFDTVLDGGYDAFVARLDAAGAKLGYAAFIGGAGDDLGQAVAVDELGYVYVAGSAQSFSLPQTAGAFDTSPNGEQDAFVLRINELGTALEYATFVGGSGQDRAMALAVDALGSVYLAGTSDSPDFAIEPGQWNAADKGHIPARLPDLADAFVAKLSVGTPFLDLPVSYPVFGQAALGNVGDRGPGRVNSWFDHSYPNHAKNNNLTRWDGTVSAFTAASSFRIGESWYDGHGGTDFRWEVWNEPVFAAASGKVIDTVSTCQVGQTSCGNYFGNRVWIDHGNGYASVYAHLKSVSVAKGTVIADPAAQPLGIMGNTGRSLGTHLHLGLYYDANADGQWTRDEAVDPFGWSGTRQDPWDAPSRYLWKQPLYDRQVAGLSVAESTVLLSPSAWVTATIPAGALSSPATVELWDVPPTAEPAAQWHSTGLAFWLKADPSSPAITFAEPVAVSLAYRPEDLRHLDPGRLTLVRWDGSSKTWDPLPTAVDAGRHQASAQTTEFGRFDLHAPLLCPADSTEPDDDHGAALPISTDGIAVSRVFDIQDDVDWFRIEAQAGKVYAIQTGRVGQGVTTNLKVYDADSSTPLASGKASLDGSAYLQWQAPLDGSYLIQVSQAPGSATGCKASYEFHVQQLFAPERITISGPAEGQFAVSYTFTATVSPAVSAQPVTYVWQIDDQPPVTHTAGLSDTLAFAWSREGSHSLSVSAANVAGAASGTHSFAVYTAALADFAATPTVGTAPLEVTFANTSGGDYDRVVWDFGDGLGSRSKNPTHTYEVAGVYTVTLTVSGPAGSDVKTRAAYITVQPQSRQPGTAGYHVYLPFVVRRR